MPNAQMQHGQYLGGSKTAPKGEIAVDREFKTGPNPSDRARQRASGNARFKRTTTVVEKALPMPVHAAPRGSTKRTLPKPPTRGRGMRTA